MVKNILYLTLIFNTAFGQEFINEMITDRPDQTESATTIQKFGIQIETGSAYGENKAIDNIDLPSTLLRYGLIHGTELRFGFDYTMTRRAQENFNGEKAFNIGLKQSLLDENTFIPQTGFIIDAPLNSSDFEPGLLCAVSWKLPNSINLGINLGADNFLTDFVFKYSSAIGFPVNESLEGYIEFYGNDRHNELNVLSDIGITYMFKNDNQIDMSIGQAILNEDSWYIAFGYSTRLILNRDK